MLPTPLTNCMVTILCMDILSGSEVVISLKDFKISEPKETAVLHPPYRPFFGGVASRLPTAIYVAMVTPILYDNSCSPNDSNLKYESYWSYG